MVGPVVPEMRLIVGKGAEGQVVLGKVPSRPLAAESAAAHQGDHRAPLDLLLQRHLHVLLLLDLHDAPLLVFDGHHALLFHLEVLFMDLQVCESFHVQHLGTTEVLDLDTKLFQLEIICNKEERESYAKLGKFELKKFGPKIVRH